MYDPRSRIAKGKAQQRLMEGSYDPVDGGAAACAHEGRARAALSRGDLNAAAHHATMSTVSGRTLSHGLVGALLEAAARDGAPRLASVLWQHVEPGPEDGAAHVVEALNVMPDSVVPGTAALFRTSGLFQAGCRLHDLIGGAEAVRAARAARAGGAAAASPAERGLAAPETAISLAACLAGAGRLDDAAEMAGLVCSLPSVPFGDAAEAVSAAVRYAELRAARAEAGPAGPGRRREEEEEEAVSALGRLAPLVRAWSGHWDAEESREGGWLRAWALQSAVEGLDLPWSAALRSPEQRGGDGAAAEAGGGSGGGRTHRCRHDVSPGAEAEAATGAMLDGACARWQALASSSPSRAAALTPARSQEREAAAAAVRSMLELAVASAGEHLPSPAATGRAVDVVASSAREGSPADAAACLERCLDGAARSAHRRADATRAVLVRAAAAVAEASPSSRRLLDLAVSAVLSSDSGRSDKWDSAGRAVLAALLARARTQEAAAVAARLLASPFRTASSAQSSSSASRDAKWDRDRPERALDALAEAGSASAAVRIAAAAARTGRPLNARYAARIAEASAGGLLARSSAGAPGGEARSRVDPRAFPWVRSSRLSPDTALLRRSDALPRPASADAVASQALRLLVELEAGAVTGPGAAPGDAAGAIRALLDAGMVDAAMHAWEVCHERTSPGAALGARLAAAVLADAAHRTGGAVPADAAAEAAAVLAHAREAAAYTCGAAAFGPAAAEARARGDAGAAAVQAGERAAAAAKERAETWAPQTVKRAGAVMGPGSAVTEAAVALAPSLVRGAVRVPTAPSRLDVLHLGACLGESPDAAAALGDWMAAAELADALTGGSEARDAVTRALGFGEPHGHDEGPRSTQLGLANSCLRSRERV